MTNLPALEGLRTALSDAGSAHHDYERNFLKGERDAQWAGFYAAFVLGRLGELATPTALAGWLRDAPAGDDWATSAAAHVLEQLRK